MSKIGSTKDLAIMVTVFVVGYLGTQIYNLVGAHDAS